MIKKIWNGRVDKINQLFILSSIVFQIYKNIDITICPFGTDLDFYLEISSKNYYEFESLLEEKYKKKLKVNNDIEDDIIVICCDGILIGNVIFNFEECN